jgi:hypothetical protein
VAEKKLSKERALLIAKAHACSHCKEYTYRRLTVKVAPAAIAEELHVAWVATKTCGVCDYKEEIGIADDGDVVFSG